MTLYEIDRAILECIDTDTGEITDFEALEGLQIEREKKLENIALYIKNLASEAVAIREEEKALAERRKAKTAKAERLERYLAEALEGATFETAKCKVSFRKSTAVDITDTAALLDYLESNHYENCIRYKEPEISLAEVTKLLKQDEIIPGAVLVERSNVNVK